MSEYTNAPFPLNTPYVVPEPLSVSVPPTTGDTPSATMAVRVVPMGVTEVGLAVRLWMMGPLLELPPLLELLPLPEPPLPEPPLPELPLPEPPLPEPPLPEPPLPELPLPEPPLPEPPLPQLPLAELPLPEPPLPELVLPELVLPEPPLPAVDMQYPSEPKAERLLWQTLSLFAFTAEVHVGTSAAGKCSAAQHPDSATQCEPPALEVLPQAIASVRSASVA